MLSSLIKRRNESEPTEIVASEPCPLEPGSVGLLKAIDIFRDLPQDAVEALMDRTSMSTAKRGAVFYGGDEGPEVLFLLKSGKVELYRRSRDGKRLTLGIVEQGAFFGEMSLVGQRLVGTYAAAVEDSVVCALTRQEVEELMERHPAVALRVIEVLARRLQQARDDLQEMTFNDVTGRVASLLLRLADRDTTVIEGYSHQDLACMVGCLRESFTVVLDRLKETGVLDIARKRIEISDRSQLERIVAHRSGAPA